MIHPLLRLAASQPHLLGDHVEAYAELVGSELRKSGEAWGRQAAFYAATGVLALVGLILTGTSLLLYAALPDSSLQLPWLMIVVPAVPVVAAVACFFAARTKRAESGFETVRKQLNEDMAVLREISAA